MFHRCAFLAWVILGLGLAARASEDAEETPLQQAARLAAEGQEREAFLKYLSVPGGEHPAARLARPKVKEFLVLLRDHQEIPLPRRKLLEGELLLALGKKQEALACFRAVAGKIAKAPGIGWDKGVMPWDYYPVEPPPVVEPGQLRGAGLGRHPFGEGDPFTLGPGSHRDNWLLRRFLALEAWTDADAEFTRIWRVHRFYTKPYVAKLSTVEENKAVERDFVHKPNGFDGMAMLFAVDYTYFLRRQKEPERARQVLLEILMNMDLDYKVEIEKLPAGKEVPYPRRKDGGRFVNGLGHYGYQGPAMLPKEFIRLAYGEFKTAGKEADLAAALQKAIDLGNNPLRRILARIRVHQGREDQALALDLAYLQKAKFEEADRAHHRAQVFAEFQKFPEAIKEYERYLDLVKVTDDHNFGATVIDPMFRLYAAQGRADDVLKLALRQFEIVPSRLEELETLLHTQERFRAAGQEKQFQEWVKKTRLASKSGWARANLSWLLKEPADVLAGLRDVLKKEPARVHDVHRFWLPRFQKLDAGRYRDFQVLLTEAVPDFLPAAWGLLVLDKKTDQAEGIRFLEKLLDAPDKYGEFQNPFLQAYKLMRLYEQHDKIDRLRVLGRRLLAARKPFDKLKDSDGTYLLTGQNYSLESSLQIRYFQNCMLVLLTHLEDEKDLRACKALLDRTGDFHLPLKNQLARRWPAAKIAVRFPTEDKRKPVKKVTVRTLGLPEGARFLASRDDAHAISPDGQWIGTGWGLVRYRYGTSDDLEIVQIPLGGRVTSFCSTPMGMFVGSSAGVYRLDDADGDEPKVVHIPLEEALPDKTWTDSSPMLIWWRGQLWAGRFQYDPKTGEVQVHESVPQPLFLAGDRLWSGRGPYDDQAGTFQSLAVDAGNWTCIGATSKEIWASVPVDGSGHRPAIVDPKTGELRILAIKGIPFRQPFRIGWQVLLAGEDEDQVWLTGVNEAFLIEYRRQTGEAWLLPWRQDKSRKSTYPCYDWNRFSPSRLLPSFDYDGSSPMSFFHYYDSEGAKPRLLAHPQQHSLSMKDGSRLWALPMDNHRGGLYSLDAKSSNWLRLGNPIDQVDSGHVYKAVLDAEAKRLYVCAGDAYIFAWPELSLVRRLTRFDGLMDSVQDAARIGNKLYLACSGRRSWEPAGLAVLDLKTGLLQRLTTADGLTDERIKALRTDGKKLHIFYEHLEIGDIGRDSPGKIKVPMKKGDHFHRELFTFPSSILDTSTGKISCGGEIWPHKNIDPWKLPKVPHLGDSVLWQTEGSGKRFLASHHGLVILDPAAKPLALAREKVRPVPTRQAQLRAEAERRPISIQTPAELAKVLADANPYFRARALELLWQKETERHQFVAVLEKSLSDPFTPVRSRAVRILAEVQSPQSSKLLQAMSKDKDRQIRMAAVVGLASRGIVAEIPLLEEVIQHGSCSALFAALATHLDAATLSLFLNHPPAHLLHGGSEELFKIAGKRLRQRPEAAEILLRARPGNRHDNQLSFAENIFSGIGAPVLPVFLKALESPDRVVRSNAARACGASKDRSAIPHLLKALDLESGLARASIVWALGELHAREAIPELAKLYLDAVQDEERNRGAGFRFSQLGSLQQAQYEHLRDLDALKADWEDLRSVLRADPADPRDGEQLLSTELVIQAARKIGMREAQDFCRALAASKDPKHRAEGAAGLAFPGPEGRQKNIKLLEQLSLDEDFPVQATATVSLLALKPDAARKRILGWLKDVDVLAEVLAGLQAVTDPAQLDFARPRLQAIAADPDLPQETRNLAARLLESKKKN